MQTKFRSLITTTTQIRTSKPGFPRQRNPPNTMPLTTTPSAPPFLLTAITLLTITTLVHAQQNDPSTCPFADDPDRLIYSPFTAYFSHWPTSDVQRCWEWASCTLALADPSRAQQFGAVALVMGLIPLTNKDIAWPARRQIPLGERPHPVLELLIRALGLEPVVRERVVEGGKGDKDPRYLETWWRNSTLAGWGDRLGGYVWIVVCSVLLLVGYGVLAVVEIYSKRSSLGCPMPLFVVSWHLVALLPAGVHVVCSKFRRRQQREKEEKIFGLVQAEVPDKSELISAVQGGDEWWVVQMCWAVYYVAGTLIYTSIMAVTVIELFAWVMVSAVVAGMSKLVAFYTCFVLMKRYRGYAMPTQ